MDQIMSQVPLTLFIVNTSITLNGLLQLDNSKATHFGKSYILHVTGCRFLFEDIQTVLFATHVFS